MGLLRDMAKKEKIKLQKPNLNDNEEIRKFILEAGIELSLEIIELTKKGIRKPKIANAQNQRYKTALNSLKVIDGILKNKQLSEFEEKLTMLEDVITLTSVDGTAENTNAADNTEAIEKIKELSQELNQIKTGA